MRTILPILLLLSLSVACVPEPLEADCGACITGDVVGPQCQDGGGCPGCPDTEMPEVTCPGCDTTGDDVPVCMGPMPQCPTDGVCADLGQVLCVDGEWLCPYWTLDGWEPTEVTCDGKDNDCDGAVDGALTPPAGTCKTQGVCQGSINPVCTDQGAWDCGYDMVVLYEDEEVSLCDGQDNDCDGLTDAEEGSPCLCNPGARICDPAEPNVVMLCPNTGAGWVSEVCPQGTECMGVGECTETGVFQVNVEVNSQQDSGAGTSVENGNWVVTWSSFNQDGSDNGVIVRKLGPDGAFLGGEFSGNVFSTQDQKMPTTTTLSDGRYLIAWESVDQFGGHTSVISRAFPEVGPSPYGEILISGDLTSDATGPAAATAGPAVGLVWEGGSSGDRDVLMRFVEAETGQPLAGEINLSAGSAGHDRVPVIAAAGEGFAVLWEKGALFTEIYGRHVDADGTPGPLLEVFSKAGDGAVDIRLAGTADHALVLWTEAEAQIVAGRIYHADLTAVTPPVPAVTLPPAAPLVGDYAVAPDGWGGFVVAWQDDESDPPAIRLRRWDPDTGLAPEVDEIVVATSDETPLTVTPHLALASGPAGKILVLWNAAALGGNGTSEVFARFVSVSDPE